MLKQRSSTTTYTDKRNMRGFSMIELLIVMSIITIMTAASLFYLTAHQDLYEAEDEALMIIDVLQEARQRSLTQRETIRVEIDITDNVVRLIDENSPGTADDDTPIRELALRVQEKVTVNSRADNVPDNPPESSPVPSAQFRQSVYPGSENNQVATMRFQSNGTIIDAGSNAAGNTGAISTGVTLHVWSPDKDNASEAEVGRAITILGSTGSIRLWLYEPDAPTGSPHWLDSRRTSTYGGV
ncbi:MAG: type II secretion system protein [Pyrinomonadaceae bacterium]|nr:type II secretion system protein [Pyrinomonadaceae bacterium]